MWRRSCPDRDLVAGASSAVRRTPAPVSAPPPGAPVGGRRTRRLPFLTCRRPLRRRPRRPSPRPSTPPTTSRSSRGSRRSASVPACTSAPPTRAASCTASGRSSTTPSTRRWAGTATAIEVILHPDGSRRGPRQRPRHPGRHRAQDRPDRRRGGLHQAARRRQVRRRLVRGIRRPARRRRLGGQRAVRAPRRRGRPRRQDLRDVLPPRRARRLLRRRRRQGPKDPEPVHARTSSSSELRGRSARPGAGVTGTRVRYWADRQIFLSDAAFDLDGLVARARQTAFLVPGLTIVIRDLRGEEPTEEVFLHDGGISEFVRVPRARPAGHRRLAAAGHRHLHRDRAGARRQGAHEPHRGRARVRRRHRAALGHRLRHPGHARSSTSSPPPRAAPTWPASTRPCSRCCASQVELNARRLKVGSDKLEKDDVARRA